MPDSRRANRLRGQTTLDELEDVSSDNSQEAGETSLAGEGTDTDGAPPAGPETPAQAPAPSPAAAPDNTAAEASSAEESPSKKQLIDVALMRQRFAAFRQQQSLIQPAAAVALADALELTESVSSDSLASETAPAVSAGDGARAGRALCERQQAPRPRAQAEENSADQSEPECGESPPPSSRSSHGSASPESGDGGTSVAGRSQGPGRPPDQPLLSDVSDDDSVTAPDPGPADALPAQRSPGTQSAGEAPAQDPADCGGRPPAARPDRQSPPDAGSSQPAAAAASSDSDSDTVRVVEDTSDPEVEAAAPAVAGRVRSSRPAELRAGAR